MGKADRVIRARDREAARVSAGADAVARRNQDAEDARLRAEGAPLIKETLRALEVAGFPNAVSIDVPAWETRVGGFRGPNRHRAAWVVTTYQTDVRGSRVRKEIYLLGNGRFYGWISGTGTLNDYPSHLLPQMIAGLRRLAAST